MNRSLPAHDEYVFPSPDEIYPPFAPPLVTHSHDYNRDWDPEGDKPLAERIATIRLKGDLPSPYNPVVMPVISDIDQDIWHTLYQLEEGKCPLVQGEDADSFFRITHPEPANIQYVLPERHQSSLSGGIFFIYRKKYCPLSNTFPAPVTWKNLKFPSVMHCVQGMKALHFEDAATLGKILQTENINTACDYADKIKGFTKAAWDKVSLDYMTIAMYSKYIQNPHLQKYILKTPKEAVFADCTTENKFWSTGCRMPCYHMHDERVYCQERWPGYSDEMAYMGALVSVKRDGPKRFYRMSETAENDFINLDDDKFEHSRPKGMHRRKIIFAAANENISEPVVHQPSSNVLSIEFPIAECHSVWPDESSPFIYVSNQNSLFALNTDAMHFLPTLRFMNVLVDSIVGVHSGVLTVSGKNEKGQLRLFTVELPEGFKVAEDSTIAAFHCDCF